MSPPDLPFSQDPPALFPKDYLETPEGLVFAVVSATPEAGRVPACLRYRRTASGGLEKIDTERAKSLIEERFPQYLYDSESRAQRLQGVPLGPDLRTHRALEGGAFLQSLPIKSPRVSAALALMAFLAEERAQRDRLGLSGSLRLGADREGSDIDLVAYRLSDFRRFQRRLRQGLEQGFLSPLREADWREAHARRVSPLPFEEYLFHEQRKANKALIFGIKCDLSLIEPERPEPEPVLRQRGLISLHARVLEDREAFGFPARYRLDHPMVPEVLSFSQSYVGQVLTGEWLWALGHLEETRSGQQRLVVGRDREATDGFIRLGAPAGGIR